MAVDKLVDSSLLDAACTYEAGKIREKLGSSAQIAYDLANGKGFGDAIDAIQTGGGGLPSNMEVIDFTPISDITSSNKLTLNFQNSYTSCFVCVYCLEQQSAPSSGVHCTSVGHFLWCDRAGKREGRQRNSPI